MNNNTVSITANQTDDGIQWTDIARRLAAKSIRKDTFSNSATRQVAYTFETIAEAEEFYFQISDSDERTEKSIKTVYRTTDNTIHETMDDALLHINIDNIVKWTSTHLMINDEFDAEQFVNIMTASIGPYKDAKDELDVIIQKIQKGQTNE